MNANASQKEASSTMEHTTRTIRRVRMRNRLLTAGAAAVLATGTVVLLPVMSSAEDKDPVTPAVQDIPLGEPGNPAEEVVEVPGDQAAASPSDQPPSSTPAESSAPQPSATETTPSAQPQPSDPSAQPAPTDSTAPSTTSDESPPSATPEAPADPAATVAPELTDELAGDETLLVLDKESVAGFSMVGVSWVGPTDPAQITVKVRTKDVATGEWSEWNDLSINPIVAPNPDAPDQRIGTDPYWFGASDGIEVGVTVADALDVGDITLTLIDPKKVTQDSTPTATAVPTGSAGADSIPMPTVYSRAQWGADESKRTWGPRYAAGIKAATIHHSADGNNYTMSDVPGLMRSIYHYQAVSLGWGDIGYNVVVDKFGRAWEGRYGGLDSTVIGAHAGGFNSNTFGLSMLGNYDVVNVPSAVREKLAQLIAWKFSLYGVEPKAKTQLTQSGGGGTTAKFKDGQTVTLDTIFGHRDVGSTACPGRYGYAMIPGLRDRVAQIMASYRVNATVYFKNSNSSGAAEATVGLQPAGKRYVACDWDRSKTQTMTTFVDGIWRIYSDHYVHGPTTTLAYGQAGDIPICGDWTGKGQQSLGVYRPSNSTFYLRDTVTSGVAHRSISMGDLGDQPLVGDWDGNGTWTVGLYRPSNATFYLSNHNVTGTPTTPYHFGNLGDTPLYGTFGNGKKAGIGVRRGNTNFLAPKPGGPATISFIYGDPKDKVVMGDWNGDGVTSQAVVR